MQISDIMELNAMGKLFNYNAMVDEDIGQTAESKKKWAQLTKLLKDPANPKLQWWEPTYDPSFEPEA